MADFYTKLTAARLEIGSVLGHDAKGHYGSYTSLPAVLQAIDKPLRDAGLIHVTEIIDGVLTVAIIDEGGDGIRAGFPLPFDQAPEKIGAAISYFRRYGLGILIGFATDSDVDSTEYQKQQKQRHQEIQKIDEHYGTRMANYVKEEVIKLVGESEAKAAWVELMKLVGMDPEAPAIHDVKERDRLIAVARQHWKAAT